MITLYLSLLYPTLTLNALLENYGPDTVHCARQAHGSSGSVSVDMWRRAVHALDVGVEAATSPQTLVPLMARLELVKAIGELQVRSKIQSQLPMCL